MPEPTKEQVIDYLSNMSVIEAAGLVKELEKKWGVSAAPIVQGGPPVEEVEVEEQTEFDVILEGFGETKMEVIKLVRKITQLGLKESKDKTESAPTMILEAVGKDVAEDAKAQFEAVGAKITLK